MRSKWYVAIIGSLVVFFGYLAYQEFLFDDTASAQAAIQQQLKNAVVNSEKPSDYYGYKRAEIALKEYAKNVAEVPRGCNCGTEIDKYTEGNPEQWCTMFASWVANEAGSPLQADRTGSWKIANSRLFIDHLKRHGAFFTKEQIITRGLQPKVGDFVLFWRGDMEDNLGHIDVVVDVNGKSGTAGLVGGNIRDRIAYRENFPYLNYYGFLGFGRPEKE